MQEHYTLKLSNPSDRGKTWTVDVTGNILIGRADHCAVRLSDKSVSREQCEIAVQGGGLAIVNLSATNKTSLNGADITGSSPLHSGDVIKFGRETLRVEYIQLLSAPPSKPEIREGSGKGYTESVF